MLHQIGAGTLGPVFRAYDPEGERLVAIKLFGLDLPPERVHQLVAELERIAAAGLTRPGIAAPIAAGIHDNAAYLAQEFFAADSLDVLVRDYGPAPPGDAVQVAVQLAGALDFAAVVNVTHGGLHPRDVLLSTDEARLTGVGVTRALERAGVTAPVRRPYTAPERIAGAAWDRRADIFSLAAILHEMLWGSRLQGTGRHAADALTELPGADLVALRAAFARALAERPQDRFDTALEFAAALKQAFPGVKARPSTTDARPATDSARSTGEPRLPASSRLPLEPADVEIRAAEPERFHDVEVAQAILVRETAPAPPAATLPPSGVLGLNDSAARESALERSRSALWPLVLALVVGLALGFAGGYGVGSRDRSVAPGAALAPASDATTANALPAAASAAASGQTAPTTGREFTDAPVADAKADGRAPADAGAPVSGSGRLPPSRETSAPPVAVPPAPAPAPTVGVESGHLLVRSTPAGARVFVDGRDRGRTPATIRDLARGTHRVRVVQQGYTTEERRVVLAGSRTAQAISVALTRTPTTRAEPAARASVESFYGSLSVDSRPPGARVFVDGKLVGTTPATLPQIGAGEHVVRIEHEGYRNWSSSVRVVAAERNRVTASLEK